jgi:hypothetical protein
MGASLYSRDHRHAYVGYVFQSLNAFVVNLAPNAGISSVAERRVYRVLRAVGSLHSGGYNKSACRPDDLSGDPG